MHFATATRFVYSYIESRMLDVLTPADLVCALNHGDGMLGCIGELFDLDTNSRAAEKWLKCLNSGELQALGRCNEIRYVSYNSDHVIVETFAYKYSAPVQWRFEVGKSICLSKNQAVEEVDNTGEQQCMDNSCIEESECFEIVGNNSQQQEVNINFVGENTAVKLLQSGSIK